jgi:hypothetical protein
MALGSRNGVDRGSRRLGESPPRNRLETPWPLWPAGALLRHAGGLRAVSSRIPPLIPGNVLPECAAHGFAVHHRENSLTVGRVTVAWRDLLYSAASGERSGPWSNLMPLRLSVQGPGSGLALEAQAGEARRARSAPRLSLALAQEPALVTLVTFRQPMAPRTTSAELESNPAP